MNYDEPRRKHNYDKILHCLWTACRMLVVQSQIFGKDIGLQRNAPRSTDY